MSYWRVDENPYSSGIMFSFLFCRHVCKRNGGFVIYCGYYDLNFVKIVLATLMCRPDSC